MLAEHETAKALCRFMPTLDPDESDLRDLYCVPNLYDWLYQSHPRKALNYAANIRAFLKRFVVGGKIDNRDYMKSGIPDVFWLRVQNQKEGERVRIFGCFAKVDKFVAFFQKPRNWFDDHPERWCECADLVVSEWQRYFAPRNMVPSVPFSNCISANAYDYDKGDDV